MFLSRFPDDPRCKQLRDYQEENELEHLQRKFDLRDQGAWGCRSLLPVEQAYQEALNYARARPRTRDGEAAP